jgi:hypothetical protein
MLPNGAKGVGGPRVGRWGGRLARNRSPTARAHRANRPRPTPLPHPWPRCPPSQPHGPETWTERLTACHIPGGLHAHERNHPNPISQKPTNCATDPELYGHKESLKSTPREFKKPEIPSNTSLGSRACTLGHDKNPNLLMPKAFFALAAHADPIWSALGDNQRLGSRFLSK